MDYRRFLRTLRSGTKRRLRHQGPVTAGAYVAHRLYYRGVRNKLLRSERFEGMPIYEKDWDVLVVLDACRFDLMKEVLDEEPRSNFGPLERHVSVAGRTNIWLKENFSAEYRSEVADTVYVTGNPQTDPVFHQRADTTSPTAFEHLDEVWRYAWDDDLGTTPARAVTDRAIENHRERDPERMVVHYMQPHFPSVPSPDLGNRIDPEQIEGTWKSVWRDLARGKEDRDEVWDAYRTNLSYVLDDVDVLLRNVDADDVVVTSDHGNAVGEVGYFGHGVYDLPSVREVPWITTSAVDTGSHAPAEYEECPPGRAVDVDERLRSLGYK